MLLVSAWIVFADSNLQLIYPSYLAVLRTRMLRTAQQWLQHNLYQRVSPASMKSEHMPAQVHVDGMAVSSLQEQRKDAQGCRELCSHASSKHSALCSPIPSLGLLPGSGMLPTLAACCAMSSRMPAPCCG